ncbi:A-kinase anchor protein 17B-like isoform X2 [Varanus komodoensis]|uniref:A-kinase anchor protein 17B-like isoform X2 n=1 Tax=Varanus komodoensis TaxID=61221 RepID=UPI001CF7743F|nr:A-kinase anchor protein 17B-like isoform X2 [Varanus komodoensis]
MQLPPKGHLDTMTITLVCDPSEAMELCASQQLYLKPVAKLAISVVLPEHTGSTRAFSKWEVMDKLKNMICPDQFTSVKVSKSTKGFIRFEGEAETKHLICSLKEKLHGKMIKLNGFKDDLQVVATEVQPDFSTPPELEPNLNNRELPEEDFAEQSKDIPDCIHLEGLPCKWFALKGSDSETPSEEVLRAVFEGFGKIKNVDIPMLDPYREEMVGGSVNNFTFRGLRTFEAFVQYQEPTSFSKAMETLKGMKLMFKGDDGKALACNIKVTPDTASHFSESAINQRNLERLTLQGLERERKREESRGKKGTERKRRDDDEKKVAEGKRKSKIKRREKRQIDRDEKRPRKQPKVAAGEELWPDNMPEWEERKYLLAQRRVESIRLLTVLLSQIKNFVLPSGQREEPLQDLENEREDCVHIPQPQHVLTEKKDIHYPELKDEGEPECQSAPLEDTHIWEGEEEQCIVTETDFLASPCPLGRTVSNAPVARAITCRLTEKDTDYYSACGLLQVTVTQDCKVTSSPDRGDYPGPDLGCFSKASNADRCKKQKVYETEEFIHYLLNYYQTPSYARICPGAQNSEDKSWWQRVVSCNGNGFQVSLKNKDGECLTEVSLVQNLPERDSDNYEWEVIEEEPEPTEIMPKSQACAREFSETYPIRWADSPERTSHDELDHSVLVSTGTACDKRSQEADTGLAVVPSHKPFGHVYKLKDLLEEISSDSEYFSEGLNESRSKTERKNGGCRNSCKAWPLSQPRARELLICVQNVSCGSEDGRCSKRSFRSNSEFHDSTKHSRQRLKATFKRSSSKVKRVGQKIRWPSSEEERETSRKKKKKKKQSSGNSLLDAEPHFLKTNHCGELESLGRMQRKCSKMFHHHKMKCKTFHGTGGSVKAKDAIHLSASQLQEAHQEAGGLLLRREVEADSKGWPLFPVEIIQTNPCSESVCGAELGRGC